MKYFDFTGSLGHRQCLLVLLLHQGPTAPRGVGVCIYMVG